MTHHTMNFQPAGNGVIVTKVDAIQAACEQAAVAGLRVWCVDASATETVDGLLAHFGAALQLPAWYGANLDALHDSLSDPDWCAAPGCLISLCGLAPLQERNRAACDALIDTLRDVAALWREDGIVFQVLIEA